MEQATISPELPDLFIGHSPAQIWEMATAAISRISPVYDFSRLQEAFEDTLRLFHGEYPGYIPISTPYHDLQHTLDVFICTVRLMHGVSMNGERFEDDDITLLCLAALMHDIGYAQRHGEEGGTGAQYTAVHIERGIAFVSRYLAERNYPSAWSSYLGSIILCTDPELRLNQVDFPHRRIRLLGQILGSADLVGQMADRIYLEKLLLLFLEFQEAQIGNYRSIYDLLCRTRDFYRHTMVKLNEDFGGVYTRLADHFKDSLGVDRNYYLESIGKNLDYLSQVIALDEGNYQSMLRRKGVVERVKEVLQ